MANVHRCTQKCDIYTTIISQSSVTVRICNLNYIPNYPQITSLRRHNSNRSSLLYNESKLQPKISCKKIRDKDRGGLTGTTE